MEKSGFSNFMYVVTVYLPPLRVLSYLETLVGHVMCQKGLIAVAFESYESLHLLRLNGCVGAIPTYRVYQLSDTCMSCCPK